MEEHRTPRHRPIKAPASRGSDDAQARMAEGKELADGMTKTMRMRMTTRGPVRMVTANFTDCLPARFINVIRSSMESNMGIRGKGRSIGIALALAQDSSQFKD